MSGGLTARMAIFLLDLVHRSGTVRTCTLRDILFDSETFARRAVKTAIGAPLNLTIIVKLLQKISNYFLVLSVGRPDKGIVVDVEFNPAVLEIINQQIGMFFRRPVFLPGCFFILLAVLVGAGEEEHMFAPEAIVSCKNVGGYFRIGMPDVRVLFRLPEVKSLVMGAAMTNGLTVDGISLQES